MSIPRQSAQPWYVTRYKRLLRERSQHFRLHDMIAARLCDDLMTQLRDEHPEIRQYMNERQAAKQESFGLAAAVRGIPRQAGMAANFGEPGDGREPEADAIAAAAAKAIRKGEWFLDPGMDPGMGSLVFNNIAFDFADDGVIRAALYESLPAGITYKLVRRIDSLTHEEIRERYATNMRDGQAVAGGIVRTHYPLTPAQRAWARADWSAQLRAQVQATKDRERSNVIPCEPNWVED